MKNAQRLSFQMLLMGMLLLAYPALAAEVPMVEKHIFSPGPDAKQDRTGEKATEAKKLDRMIDFTGVIISPTGRWAIIERKGRRGAEKTRTRYREGDSIDEDLVLDTIGSNFIIVSAQGKKVKMKLYRSNRKRPAPIAPRRASVKGAGASALSSKKQSKTLKRAPTTGGLKPVKRLKAGRGAQGPARRVKPRPPNRSKNPFLDALRKAAERRRQMGQQGTVPRRNPFQELMKRYDKGE